MKKVTIVSALFNIKRSDVDGRTWDEYLEWFDITLKLKCPMVLFVSADVRDFIERRRTSIPTEIIVQEIEDIPYYYLKDDIQKTIKIIMQNLLVNESFAEANLSMLSNTSLISGLATILQSGSKQNQENTEEIQKEAYADADGTTEVIAHTGTEIENSDLTAKKGQESLAYITKTVLPMIDKLKNEQNSEENN